VCETVWFSSWVNTHPFNLKFVAFFLEFSGYSDVDFQKKKLFGENVSLKPWLSSTKTCEILPNFLQFLFWVRIALKKFTQVLSYVVCTQVRRNLDKRITKISYGKEKSRRVVFGKPVLFTLGLGLTTPYYLGILVRNIYQTVVTVSIEFWIRFVP